MLCDAVNVLCDAVWCCVVLCGAGPKLRTAIMLL
jgi:hypothetical protein